MTQTEAAGEPWRAEIAVTLDIARDLVVSQFPQFAGAPAERLGEGWDNAAFAIGDAVFRFPRRAIAAELIATEIAVLPKIAGSLPVPISAPQFAGKPAAPYPWPFAGYRRLAGGPLTALRAGEGALKVCAAQLGTFLRALHGLDPAPLREAGLPGDTIGRLDHARRMPLVQPRLEELASRGLLDDVWPYVEFLERHAPQEPRADALSVVHGDLYARHLLVNAVRLCGIIDWGDVHYGDPALDVAAAYAVFAPASREGFFAAYGPVDERTESLARYRALYQSVLVAQYGLRIGDADLQHWGLLGMRQATA